VPGHRGTEGNATADKLTRLGFEYPFIGPEPACGISARISKRAARDWTDHKKHWDSLTELKYAKDFLQQTSARRTKILCETKQKPVVVGDRTTYRTLSPERHLFKMRLTNNPVGYRVR
jgi:hypothetical protein